MSGGSARQIDDVRELLRIAADRIDRSYVEAGVQELGVSDEWCAANEP
jgi:hypothetical protein